MEYLLSIAAKSLLIAGGTLLLLKVMHRRSSSDRSWVAHLGLLALLLLPVGALALPALNVVGPAFLATDATPVFSPAHNGTIVDAPAASEVASSTEPFQPATAGGGGAGIDWLFWAYVAPAGMLLLLTLIALGRLRLLKARAKVLLEPHWLQALAQAQHRMGFKNGTALLTSDELRSPISWGLMRPVILLNTDATKARDEAEAIIAHELAHVAGLDWAKLMLSRITVALFWFNPLVWLLAREAHQLREEAADDAVLAANIEDTQYANLLVGIARHECNGLLLGAHGVAPGKGSLTRRVKRVLNAALERAPGGWRWSSAAAFFAAGMTVPVAALQFVAPTIASAQSEGRFVADAPPAPHSVANVAEAPAPLAPPAVAQVPAPPATPIAPEAPRAMVDVSATTQAALAAASHATAEAHDAIDRAIALKAVGASPAYAQALRNAAPNMHLSNEDIIALRVMAITPEYLGDLARSGLPNLDADAVAEARALNIDGNYIRGMAAAGYRGISLDDLSQMKAVGITPADAARYRKASRGLPSVDALVTAKTSGLTPEDIDPDDGE
ncbi:M56 family metallopeptidase [Sphingomonas sp. SM33]|uniref:M56 family metallopeptidase n=1 Tax=Sphingomonas telluris TaxID=2907998 RepID=A0ABS9VQE2_9SPHN|nr:M56 family metallopeptidase [Sphingomonas telluris]MCH8617206.1 M56 family metallopeptidase [Sphingomonas telluris]